MNLRTFLTRGAATLLAGSLTAACVSEDDVAEDDARIANGVLTDIAGVGQILFFHPELGWVPGCTASVYRGNTLVTAEHCVTGLQGVPLAFTTDWTLPRTATGLWALPNPDIRSNGLQDARVIVDLRVFEHPTLDNEAVPPAGASEGVGVLRVDEAYERDAWWNISTEAYLGPVMLVGYGVDPFDDYYPQLADDPYRELSSGDKRLGFMNLFGVGEEVAGAPPPPAFLERLSSDQASCPGDSGGPGFQFRQIVTVTFGAPAGQLCYEDSLTVATRVGLYRDKIDEAVAEWNECLLAADFDGDGTVSGADRNIWDAHYGCSDCRPNEGDANGDGFVSGGDFLTWQASYGETCGFAPRVAAPS